MTSAFGKLVAAKLTERRMSQRRLARSISRSPSYVNYLVRGTSPQHGKGEMRPGVEIVRMIAVTLGIPLDEALAAAGHDPQIFARSAAAAEPAGDTAAPPGNKGGLVGAVDATKPAGNGPAGDEVFDIAYAAALTAINTDTPAPTRKERIKIELSDRMHLMLINGGNKLSGEEVERYKRAFLAAYQALNE